MGYQWLSSSCVTRRSAGVSVPITKAESFRHRLRPAVTVRLCFDFQEVDSWFVVDSPASLESCDDYITTGLYVLCEDQQHFQSVCGKRTGKELITAQQVHFLPATIPLSALFLIHKLTRCLWLARVTERERPLQRQTRWEKERNRVRDTHKQQERQTEAQTDRQRLSDAERVHVLYWSDWKAFVGSGCNMSSRHSGQIQLELKTKEIVFLSISNSI